jgi:hypothetical protein
LKVILLFIEDDFIILTSYLFPIDWFWMFKITTTKKGNIKMFRSSYHIITINDQLLQSTSDYFPVTAYHRRYLAIYFIGSFGVKVLNVIVWDAIKKILSRFWQGLKTNNYQIRKVWPLPLHAICETDLIFYPRVRCARNIIKIVSISHFGHSLFSL